MHGGSAETIRYGIFMHVYCGVSIFFCMYGVPLRLGACENYKSATATKTVADLLCVYM